MLKTNTSHKFTHNVTTLANIPLLAWLICSIISLAGKGYEEFEAWMAHPVNILAAIFFVVVSLKHFTLELEVVLEDYISNICLRKAIILGINIFALVLGTAAIVSVLKLGI